MLVRVPRRQAILCPLHLTFSVSRKSPHDEDSAEFRERMSREVEDLEKTYDQNHNEVFEPNEIAEWIAPVDYDLVSAETHHLIHAADDDGVGSWNHLEGQLLLPSFHIRRYSSYRTRS